MEFSARPVRTLAMVLVAALLSACAPKEDAAARKAIDQISAAIESAGPDATKYVPGHVAALQGQVTKFKVRFYDHDYKAIIAEAPSTLERAEGLSATAAAKKAEIAKVLIEEGGVFTTEDGGDVWVVARYVSNESIRFIRVNSWRTMSYSIDGVSGSIPIARQPF